MVEGWFFATAALLVVSGINKLLDPTPTAGALRIAGLIHHTVAVAALAIAEIVVGAGSLIFGRPFFGWAQALIYGGFAAFVVVALMRRIPLASCGCFGKTDSPPTWLHVIVNVTAAFGAIVFALSNLGGIGSIVTSQPLAGLPYLGFVALGAYCLYLLLGDLPLLRTQT